MLYPIELQAPVKLLIFMVPKGRFELPRPCGHCALNAARLPFRHFGKYQIVGGNGLDLVYMFTDRTLTDPRDKPTQLSEQYYA